MGDAGFYSSGEETTSSTREKSHRQLSVNSSDETTLATHHEIEHIGPTRLHLTARSRSHSNAENSENGGARRP